MYLFSVFEEFPDLLTGFEVIKAGAADTGDDDLSAVGQESQRVDKRTHGQSDSAALLFRGNVPELEDSITVAGQQRLAVRQQSAAASSFALHAQASDFFAIAE